MVFLGTPAHAAVSATVEALDGPGRGFANAVLRRVAEQTASGPPVWPDDATRLSYPDWIVERLSADIGPEPALAALAAMNEPASATVRADGYVQDLASQWVAAAVGAGPGERVIDLCAAPGGKATWMAYGPGGPGEPGRGPGGRPALVVAADLDPDRAVVMASNVSRLGLDNVATLVADACRPPLPAGSFDRVLVDAPCSGLGVLRRRPDARWRIQPGDLPRLAALQRRMIEAALPLVRPGGLLVYSVCTLTLAETAGIDRWLAGAHPEARPVMPPGPPWDRVGRGARLLPQTAGTDGMFVLALQVPAPALHR
jgi:16S rRNA (cytosine967-C5)-methyltransferase